MEEKGNGTILVVDDHSAVREILQHILTLGGYETLTASHAKAALSLVSRATPDLILLDLMLPDEDGIALTQKLRQLPQLSDVPIVFISAQAEIEDKVRAFEAGAWDYITKPFKAREVLARVATHLQIYHLKQSLAEANMRLQAQVEELARVNAELNARNAELAETMATIKTLQGLLPICAWCGRKVEDEPGHWVNLETYITEHTGAEFTHGICPDCLVRFMGQVQNGTNGTTYAQAHPQQHTNQSLKGSSR